MTILILVFYCGRTVQLLFNTWVTNAEVQFVWQAALTDIAGYLDENPNIQAAAIAGWTPETMDQPTLALTLRRQDLALRHMGAVGGVETAVIPAVDAANGEGNAYIFRPTILPFNYYIEQQLFTDERPPQEQASFTFYMIPRSRTFTPQHPAGHPAVFSKEVQFLGHDWLLTPDLGSIELITYWRVLKSPPHPRRFFLHMLDRNGEPLAQHDDLDAAAQTWRPGDIVIQYHTLPQLNIPFDLHLGVYDPNPPFARLTTQTGADHIEIPLSSPPSE